MPESPPPVVARSLSPDFNVEDLFQYSHLLIGFCRLWAEISHTDLNVPGPTRARGVARFGNGGEAEVEDLA